MQFKKEILLFYILILISAGVIIAADQPKTTKEAKPCTKCCTIPGSVPSAAPLNMITDGLLRYKA